MHVFQCDVFQRDVFQNACSSSSAEAGSSAGGFAAAWRRDRERLSRIRQADERRRHQILNSKEYLRLKRKLEMARETLEMARWFDKERVLNRIRAIEKQMMDMLD